MRKAVFLDRDGVVIRQVEGYLDDPEEVELLPGAARAIKRLREAGFAVVVVTNQAGIGHGRLTEGTLAEIHRRLAEELSREGAALDGIYHCPHTPEDRCPCRKPAPGMLLRAAEELGLDLTRSYMVGDMTTDIEAGKRAGCFTVLVRTGFGGSDGRSDCEPDAVCDDLPAACELILRRERDR
ncbi:D-glycero-beta-D-manno-heptose 1,7-bisphosphate 7-phosphatase [Candidatus Bipolaricaulota sp. J31]